VGGCGEQSMSSETVTEPESIGKYLRDLREQRKLSLEEVEEATRIRVDILRAIESDDNAKGVPIVYARGFIRSYARFLGADSAELSERFKNLHGNASSEMTIPPVGALSRSRGLRLSRKALLSLIIGVTVLATAVVSYFLHSRLFWPYKVTVRAAGRVPIRVYRDGQFIWGSTIDAGKEQSWRGKKSIQLKIRRPENARVIYRGRRITLPDGDTVSVIFDRHGIKKATISRLEEPARTSL